MPCPCPILLNINCAVRDDWPTFEFGRVQFLSSTVRFLLYFAYINLLVNNIAVATVDVALGIYILGQRVLPECVIMIMIGN